jgi:hypothetical protein
MDRVSSAAIGFARNPVRGFGVTARLDSFAQCGPKQTCRLLLEVRCDVTVNVGSHLKRTVAEALLNDLHGRAQSQQRTPCTVSG